MFVSVEIMPDLLCGTDSACQRTVNGAGVSADIGGFAGEKHRILDGRRQRPLRLFGADPAIAVGSTRKVDHSASRESKKRRAVAQVPPLRCSANGLASLNIDQ